jgi:hypothetical protein
LQAQKQAALEEKAKEKAAKAATEGAGPAYTVPSSTRYLFAAGTAGGSSTVLSGGAKAKATEDDEELDPTQALSMKTRPFAAYSG